MTNVGCREDEWPRCVPHEIRHLRAGGHIAAQRRQRLDVYKRQPQQGILRDNEKRVLFRVLRELVDGGKQEGTSHPDRDLEELVADLVALHRGMLLEWRIYEGAFDLPRRGRRMAAALLEGWKHEE